MTGNTPDKHSFSPLLVWRVYFTLLILLGFITLGLIFQSRSETGVLFGLSGTRMAIVAGILCLLAVAVWLLFVSWRNPQICIQRITSLVANLGKPGRWAFWMLLMGFGLVVGSYILTLLPDLEEPFTAKFLERLSPVIFWLAGFCAQTLVALLYLRHGSKLFALRLKAKLFWIALALFSIVFLIWVWGSRSFIPAVAEKVGWNLLGSPILEFQVLIAWGLGLVVLLLVNRSSDSNPKRTRLKRFSPAKVDLAIAGLIWLSAVLLWQSTPITPNWFLSEKLSPNQAYYPYSDARHYDRVAQSALIGEGFKFFNGWDVRRPLHGAYLTLLHVIAGQEYERVIAIQVLLLAFLPVLIYFLTKSLHHRSSGVIAAIIVIFRETNSISITGNITTSNVKLLMVDLFVAMAVVVFAILAIKWLRQIVHQLAQSSESQPLLALVSGGALGLAMLIRLETTVLSLSPLFILSLIALPKKKYSFLCKQLALFFLGIALVISPWVYRNWWRTGQLFVDSPLFRFGLISQRFKPSNTPTPAITPTGNGQAPTTLTSPAATAVPTGPATAQPPVQERAQNYLQALFKQPGELISYTLAHYTNSQLQSILIFPTTFRGFDSSVAFLAHRDPSRFWTECCSLSNYTRRVPYWHKWDGAFPSQSILPIIFSLLVIAAGIQTTWNSHKLVALMPIFSMLVYFSFNAALRNSGGRYILPVDWAGILFYSIGIAQLTFSVLSSVTGKKLIPDLSSQAEPAPAAPVMQPGLLRKPQFYTAAAGLFLAGCIIPAIEFSFPQRYTPGRTEQMLAAVWVSPDLPEQAGADLKGFLSRGGVVTAGRALYPQFFPAGYGTQDIDYDPLAPKPYPRLVFDLTGVYSQDLALPFEKRAVRFPNASDVLVFECPIASLYTADPLAVAVFDANDRLTDVYLRKPWPSDPACPLPAVIESN
jgi:hypothetical protein